jgi:hypothetical protein
MQAGALRWVRGPSRVSVPITFNPLAPCLTQFCALSPPLITPLPLPLFLPKACAESDAMTQANMEARAARNAEEEMKKREESKLNDYQGYVSGTWGAETEKPEEIDPEKVRRKVEVMGGKELEGLMGNMGEGSSGASGTHSHFYDIHTHRSRRL